MIDRSRLRRAPRGLSRRIRSWSDAVELRRFQTELSSDSDAPAVLLSPHWDDAVFDCWSLLSGPSEIRVVNVFGGIPAPGPARRWDRICGAVDAAEQARARLREDRHALASVGREPKNLPFLDAEYRQPGGPPSLAEIDAAVAAVAPRASAIFAPACLGTNFDHRLTRRYARALAGCGLEVHLYADIPYCVTHGWPHWVTGDPPDPHRDVDVFWATFLDAVPEVVELRNASVVELEVRQAERKLAAMKLYESQFSALDGGGIGLLSDPAVHGIEVSWRLEPIASDC